MKTTTPDRDPEAASHLRELIGEISVAMVVTVSPEGTLRSRPLLTRQVADDGELWFYTLDDSEAVHDLEEEHAVNVSYADSARDCYVSVTGQASVVKDEAKLRELWDPVLTRYFPEGLDEPHLALLRVRIEFAEFWDATASKMIPVRQATHQHAASDKSDGRKDRRSAEGKDGRGSEGGVEHTKVEIRATPASG